MPFPQHYVDSRPRYSWVPNIGWVPARPQPRRHHDIYRPRYSHEAALNENTRGSDRHRNRPHQPPTPGREELETGPTTRNQELSCQTTQMETAAASVPVNPESESGEGRPCSLLADQQLEPNIAETTTKKEGSNNTNQDKSVSISETSTQTSLILEEGSPTRVSGDTGHATGAVDSQSQSTPPRSPSPRALAGRPEPVCVCPISDKCAAKDDALIDCRHLVLEWKKWETRAKEKPPVLPLDRDPANEAFVTLDEALVIIRLLDQVEIRPRLQMSIQYVFDKIRDWNRKMLHNSISKEVLDEGGIMQRLKGFLGAHNAAMRQAKKVPFDIIEDLTYLHCKWDRGDLSVLPRRGLIRSAGGGPSAVDPKWPYARSANFYGHGHLVNGQTWISRAAMVRDGAHSALQAGICGTVKDGARSIVMGFYIETTKEGYADRDFGETIEYIGTALKRKIDDVEPTNIKDLSKHRSSRKTKNTAGDGPTNATECLMTSYRNGKPVRLFRAWMLPRVNSLRPLKGFRYDGLYEVKKYELLKKERQIYKFVMTRMREGQGPLREVMPPFEPPQKKKRKAGDELGASSGSRRGPRQKRK
ncbi:hypothetical protein H2204_000571 [Knufia peltigerae]|uniref:YDG domain-containing protein n=1 Tax=Knufia peltigerae TaxID=1002370 RepID=A0AA38YEW7_9EURO|nr:hypothetical protein H2204_000571 [Knufia peltigerae]